MRQLPRELRLTANWKLVREPKLTNKQELTPPEQLKLDAAEEKLENTPITAVSLYDFRNFIKGYFYNYSNGMCLNKFNIFAAIIISFGDGQSQEQDQENQAQEKLFVTSALLDNLSATFPGLNQASKFKDVLGILDDFRENPKYQSPGFKR